MFYLLMQNPSNQINYACDFPIFRWIDYNGWIDHTSCAKRVVAISTMQLLKLSDG